MPDRDTPKRTRDRLKADLAAFVLARATDSMMLWRDAYAKEGIEYSVGIVHRGTLSNTYQVRTPDAGTRYFEVSLKEIGG